MSDIVKAAKPCVKRGDCLYDEDEYVAHNPFFVRRDGEDAVRTDHKRMIEKNFIPPACPVCGWHHR
jgi:hypothetical protein